MKNITVSNLRAHLWENMRTDERVVVLDEDHKPIRILLSMPDFKKLEKAQRDCLALSGANEARPGEGIEIRSAIPRDWPHGDNDGN